MLKNFIKLYNSYTTNVHVPMSKAIFKGLFQLTGNPVLGVIAESIDAATEEAQKMSLQPSEALWITICATIENFVKAFDEKKIQTAFGSISPWEIIQTDAFRYRRWQQNTAERVNEKIGNAAARFS